MPGPWDLVLSDGTRVFEKDNTTTVLSVINSQTKQRLLPSQKLWASLSSGFYEVTYATLPDAAVHTSVFRFDPTEDAFMNLHGFTAFDRYSPSTVLLEAHEVEFTRKDNNA